MLRNKLVISFILSLFMLVSGVNAVVKSIESGGRINLVAGLNVSTVYAMSFLTQPYPHERLPKLELVISLSIGGFIFLFLLIFKPFGIDHWQTPLLGMKLMGFGLVSSVIMLLYYFVLPLLIRPLRTSEHWTVGYELLSEFLIIFSIALCNFAYLKRIVPGIEHTIDIGVTFPEIYGYTFLLGIFPVCGLVCLNYILQLNKYVQLASGLPEHRLSATPDLKKISFTAENGTDKISLSMNQLIYIEAEDNYAGINYFKDAVQVKRLLRTTLSRIEFQVQESGLVRCHRSFLVNLDHVQKVTGNAQGYRFWIRDSEIQIPVGRTYNFIVQQYKQMEQL